MEPSFAWVLNMCKCSVHCLCVNIFRFKNVKIVRFGRNTRKYDQSREKAFFALAFVVSFQSGCVHVRWQLEHAELGLWNNSEKDKEPKIRLFLCSKGGSRQAPSKAVSLNLALLFSQLPKHISFCEEKLIGCDSVIVLANISYFLKNSCSCQDKITLKRKGLAFFCLLW